MVVGRVLHRGTVKNGVIVPESGTDLPDGTVVQFTADPLALTPEERAEADAWERLSDEAWGQIDWGNEDNAHVAG